MKRILLTLAVLCLSAPISEARKPWPRDPAPAPAPGGRLDLAQIESTLPICRDRSKAPFRANNEEVLKWKTSTRNQYKDRALVIGRLVRVVQERRSHLHLEVSLVDGDETPANNIEIIYNREFGDVVNPVPGQIVAACGDYITATERSGGYPPSPVGAIVHWVHASNKPQGHSHGYLSVGGKLYGYEGDGAKQRPEMPNGRGGDEPWNRIAYEAYLQ